jgi:hypothetical protein
MDILSFLRKIDISKLNAVDLFLKNVNDLETKVDCELKIYKCQLENKINNHKNKVKSFNIDKILNLQKKTPCC